MDSWLKSIRFYNFARIFTQFRPERFKKRNFIRLSILVHEKGEHILAVYFFLALF